MDFQTICGGVVLREGGFGVGQERPGDVVVSNFDGEKLFVDVVVGQSTDFYAPFLEGAAIISESISIGKLDNYISSLNKIMYDQKEKIKNFKYLEKCNLEGVRFLPFVVGSLGGFGDGAELILQHLASRKATKENLEYGVALERLRIKINIAVQKSQANAILTGKVQNLQANAGGGNHGLIFNN